ncbi:helix-turn-helix domain-containing protein [Streptomyces griseorubiginosus]|uniref:helix-turn-helix domain-containing protein n=1 Tax=Streptomyces griseorubiginosus TaxID=67304 RepID=UPI0036ED0BFB
MLELTDEPVSQLSRRVGHLDASNFRRLFQRATGVTPSEYRNRFGIAARVSPHEDLPTGQPTRIRSTPLDAVAIGRAASCLPRASRAVRTGCDPSSAVAA